MPRINTIDIMREDRVFTTAKALREKLEATLQQADTAANQAGIDGVLASLSQTLTIDKEAMQQILADLKIVEDSDRWLNDISEIYDALNRIQKTIGNIRYNATGNPFLAANTTREIHEILGLGEAEVKAFKDACLTAAINIKLQNSSMPGRFRKMVASTITLPLRATGQVVGVGTGLTVAATGLALSAVARIVYFGTLGIFSSKDLSNGLATLGVIGGGHAMLASTSKFYRLAAVARRDDRPTLVAQALFGVGFCLDNEPKSIRQSAGMYFRGLGKDITLKKLRKDAKEKKKQAPKSQTAVVAHPR